ncbi:MAG: hypothetical protein ABSG91_17955 [Syntrophobacteraceae bacterium]
MRKMAARIFVFVIAAGLVGSVHLAFAIYPEKSIRETKATAGTDDLGEYVISRIGECKYALLGIGGTTLDPGGTPPATPPKPPETPQPETPQPAPPETPKEHGMLPPAVPLTPQPEPRGFGAAPPAPVVTPGEVPKREQVKEETGSKKPVPSKVTRKKRKEKSKTTAEPAKKAKRVKPRSQKTVQKPPETSTGKARAPARHPTPVDVTKSLKSQETGRPAPKPETQKRTTPSSRKKRTDQPGTTLR